MESATENNNLHTFSIAESIEEMVKTCGKSVRLYVVIHMRGKPYQKQDKEVCVGYSFRLNIRVCRIDKWLSVYGIAHYYT